MPRSTGLTAQEGLEGRAFDVRILPSATPLTIRVAKTPFDIGVDGGSAKYRGQLQAVRALRAVHHSSIQMKLFQAYDHYPRQVVERIPSFPVPKARRSKRVVGKRRASLVINLNRKVKRLPCLVLDSSKEGFRLRGSFDLRRGQVVELILDEETPCAERCNVVWVGKIGSKQEGEVGLETV
jgi:hypothetical protein